jgi:hypothetical protein
VVVNENKESGKLGFMMMNCVMDYDEVENSPTIKKMLPIKK